MNGKNSKRTPSHTKRNEMNYKLSDRELSELCLFISVRQIKELFPDYAPSVRTIYRRLAKHGINLPSDAQSNFKTKLLLAAPVELDDNEANALIDKHIQTMFEELCATIENSAELYRLRHK